MGKLISILALVWSSLISAYAQTEPTWFEKAAIPGHTLEVIADGPTLLNKRLEKILSAKRSVYLSTFIYDSDISPRQIGWALCEKAKAGLDVRLMLDGYGGKNFYKNYADTLRECGVAVMLFNPTVWGFTKAHYVIHEKLLITDGETVMMGGNGVGDAYHKLPGAKKYYHDIDVKIDGPAACIYHRQFIESWKKSVKKDRPSADYTSNGRSNDMEIWLHGSPQFEPCEEKKFGDSKVIPLYSNPFFYKTRPILEHYKLAMENAKTSIDLNAPYFIPNKGFIDALIAALKRGVKVRLMTNSLESSDEGVVTLAGMLMKIPPLLKAGIEVRLYKGPETFHRKGGAFDRQIVYFGSDNLDNRGHQFQSETVAFTNDAKAASEFMREFESDIQESVALDEAYIKRIWKETSKLKRWVIKRIIKQL